MSDYSINGLAKVLGPVSVAAQLQRKRAKPLNRAVFALVLSLILIVAGAISAYFLNSKIPSKTLIYSLSGAILGSALIISSVAVHIFKKKKEELNETLNVEELRKHVALEEIRCNITQKHEKTLMESSSMLYRDLAQIVKEISIEDLTLPNIKHVSSFSNDLLKLYYHPFMTMALLVFGFIAGLFTAIHTHSYVATVAVGFSVPILPFLIRLMYLASHGLIKTPHRIKTECQHYCGFLVLGIIGYFVTRVYMPQPEGLIFFSLYSALPAAIWISSAIYIAAYGIKKSKETQNQENWLYNFHPREVSSNELTTICNELNISNYIKKVNEIKEKLPPVRQAIVSQSVVLE